MSFLGRKTRGRRRTSYKGSARRRQSLRFEPLERRELLAVLGVVPGYPLVDYNSTGTVDYVAESTSFVLEATPNTIQIDPTLDPPLSFPVFISEPRSFRIDILVGNDGQLIGGVPGDDLTLVGTVDLTPYGLPSASGTLLTGEIVAFGSHDSESFSTTDSYDFRFRPTGGALVTLFNGKDIGVTTLSESSGFAGDFTVDFGGGAKGNIGPIEPSELVPGIDIEKHTNGADADDPDGLDVPEIAPDGTVTWTYYVTNTGQVPFTFDQVAVTDDNGTPGDTSDDFTPTFEPSSDAGSDGILSPGETWTYTATGTAQDLTTVGSPIVVDFDTDGGGLPLSAGTVVDDEYADFGLTITSQNPMQHPAMIFDSAHPTGGDWDLATPGYHSSNTTPLGNVLIVSEDADSSDPDDNAWGGTLTFIWDEPVTVDTLSLLDIDCDEGGGSVVTFIQEDGTVSVPIPVRGDNSFQRLDIYVDNVVQMDVHLVSSGAVTELVFRPTEKLVYENKAVVTADGVDDEDPSHYKNPGPQPAIDIEKYVKKVCGGEGLTPGFWKQSHHFSYWTGHNSGDSYNSVFGVHDPDSPTLLEALGRGGGGYAALGRHAVAALLNAASANVDYAFTEDQIIGMVQQGYCTGDFESFKNQLEAENEQGADLKDGCSTSPPGYGDDADEPTGPTFKVGQSLEFTYVVTNPGEVPLADVTVVDDNGTAGDASDDFSPAFDPASDDGDGILSPGETWVYTYTMMITCGTPGGQHVNDAEATGTPVDAQGQPIGDDVSDHDAAYWYVDHFYDEIPQATVSGIVWDDANDDGVVDFDESAIRGAVVRLTGTNDRGEAVDLVATTDSDGVYMFANLRPSDADGYSITETQPDGYDDGKDVLGTVGGVPVGFVDGNDKFSGIVLAAGQDGENYNFGEHGAETAEFVTAGQTATIGFWQNRNGQRLIKSLNGGKDKTELGDWLARTFPNLYGDLAGKSNAYVADYYSSLFKQKKCWRLDGPAKLDPQAMAVALAIYVTDTDLAGTTAEAYGFKVSSAGLGGASFDIDAALRDGSAEMLFGSDTSIMTVMDIMQGANSRSSDGVLFDADGNGRIDWHERLLRSLANELFTAINEAGDIR